MLIKEILKRFCLKLIRFKTCVLEEKYILDTHHHVSFIHDSRESKLNLIVSSLILQIILRRFIIIC